MANVRELLTFPQGDNASDTFISGVHYNLTTLRHWNYTYYSNRTFSNGSLCFLLFEPYTPHLLQNGTFLNSTSCYSPILSLKTRSKLGLLYACFFGLSVMFTCINLRKHGKLFLPVEKRFHAVGRRWQWYWMLVVATCAITSGITGVDVDRYYLPELPIVLSNFFWFLMLPSTMCVVWESVRHWGSWQERQMIDSDPVSLRQDDRRSTVELLLPLVFYFFFWMNFFMAIPRSWSAIEKQRDPDQARNYAEPTATDIRFMAAAVFLFASWITTVYSLYHSIKHYKPRNRGILNSAFGLVRYIPPKFVITLPLSLAMIGYNAACALEFSISPLKVDANLGMVYGLGWGSVAMVFLVHEIFGYIDPNEDKELIRQRRIRGAEIDREIGILKKPHWWSRLHGKNRELNVHDQIARNVTEIGGGQATTRNLERSMEMGHMPVSNRGNNKTAPDIASVRAAASLLFPAKTMAETQERFTDHPETARGRALSSAMVENRRPEMRADENDRSDSHHSTASGLTLGAGPQQIRSMLDV